MHVYSLSPVGRNNSTDHFSRNKDPETPPLKPLKCQEKNGETKKVSCSCGKGEKPKQINLQAH